MPRRDQIRMTDAEIRAFLRAQKTVILNTIGPDGVPHPMPMWFVSDDDCAISMATFRGTQKIVNLQRDPRVSLLVESGREYAELKGVVIYGTAELSTDTDAIIATLEAASQKETTEAGAKARAAIHAEVIRTAPKRILIRVTPDRIISWDHSKLGGTY
ncbi:MAG: TIGR03618 family F420-dependent PPOX class oxidoreductase [Deltaproteobacteria bacterium]|nr:TIGR03618 family F420-dependent PPOX class oxidoreductase [Deltaproteobacteria bacterium]MBW2542347.1 TIGR03618 family F420-dependent PPOX class oxidoreductase [Deltaproteobacteria bacterium]